MHTLHICGSFDEDVLCAVLSCFSSVARQVPLSWDFPGENTRVGY